jgi:hypothetical protein
MIFVSTAFYVALLALVALLAPETFGGGEKSCLLFEET